MKKALVVLSMLLASVGLADYVDVIDGLAATLPDWLAAFALLVGAAAPLAALTPWKWDNRLLKFLRKVLDALGFNVNAAENKRGDTDE